ncbi:glycosylhydrolase family 18-6 [Apiospora phragmitis]|uniref:Glycosylhydrolase family 18-6 n=1 Tax=Apiospora phragmitis TaxID=2905665 RepID=A0ABR1VCX2_9PEZI
MVTSPWLTAAFGAIGLMLSAEGVSAKLGASTSSRGAETCPERCSVSGSRTGNRSGYPSFKKVRRCQKSMFIDFTPHDDVDDPDSNHRIHACSSYGPDFSTLPYAPSGQATISLYVGQSLLNHGLTASALQMFEDNLTKLNVSSPELALQLCDPRYHGHKPWQNGKKNGGAIVDVENTGSARDLMDNDIVTPGFVRMPVCSPDLARKQWNRGGITLTNTPSRSRAVMPRGSVVRWDKLH